MKSNEITASSFRWVITFAFVILLPLLPVTVWMHVQAGRVAWPTADARVVDVRLERRPLPGGEHTAPRDSVEIREVVQYEVGNEVYQRELPTKMIVDHGERELSSLHAEILGRHYRLTYNPDSQGTAPPINWSRWIAWLLTMLCAACLLPSAVWCLQRTANWIEPPRKPARNRRVLSAEEYRSTERASS